MTNPSPKPTTTQSDLVGRTRALFRITDPKVLQIYAAKAQACLLKDMPQLEQDPFVVTQLGKMTTLDTDSQFFVIIIALVSSERYRRAFALEKCIIDRIQEHVAITLQGRNPHGDKCVTTADRLHPDFRSLVAACLSLIWRCL